MDVFDKQDNEDMEFFRMIANPHRLKQVQEPVVVTKSSFESDISDTLKSEYRDVYVNAYLIDRIKQVIQEEMNDYMIERLSSKFVSDIIERCLNDPCI
jgi:hypothetical protein